MAGNWKAVGLTNVRANPDKKDPASRLGNTELFRIQDLPRDTVPSESVTAKLIGQENLIIPIRHAIHVLHHKGSRAHYPENTIEFLIEKIDGRERVSSSCLAITLAGITAHQELSVRKTAEPTDISHNNPGAMQIGSVRFASDIPNVV